MLNIIRKVTEFFHSADYVKRLAKRYQYLYQLNPDLARQVIQLQHNGVDC